MSGTSHFHEMKGDVGMSSHENKGNKKMPPLRHKVISITPSLHLCFFQDYNPFYVAFGCFL